MENFHSDITFDECGNKNGNRIDRNTDNVIFETELIWVYDFFSLENSILRSQMPRFQLERHSIQTIHPTNGNIHFDMYK